MTPEAILIAAAAALGGALLGQLGKWIPALMHKGRIEEIREAIVSTNAEKLTDMQKQIDGAWRAVKEVRQLIDELRTGHRILETLREEDKGVMHDLKDRLTRLEEKIEERITGLEKRLQDNFSQFQIAILEAIRHGDTNGKK